MKNFTNANAPVKMSTITSRYSPRVIGVVMTVFSLIAMACLAAGMGQYTKEMRAIPVSMVPEQPFVDIYGLKSAETFLLILFSVALVGFILGIYRVIANQTSKKLLFASAVIALVISAVGSTHNHAMKNNLMDELLVVQEGWADKRYGIEYDEITTKEWKGYKLREHKIQVNVMKNDEVIATVCPYDDKHILFCEPDSSTELPVYANSEY